MSLRSCLRIGPVTINHIFSKRLAILQNSCNRVYVEHNLARSVFHVRQLSQEVSKTKIDGSNERQRVYYGILTPHIRVVKWFSLTTSLCGILAQPFIYKELSQMQSIPLMVGVCSVVSFFTFVTPLLLHYITKKYILYLDYIPAQDIYVASTVNFFCMLKEVKFTPGDVKVPDVPGMFTTFVAKDIPLFLEARLFENPDHYVRIMGYDKPMDFKLYETPNKIKDEK